MSAPAAGGALATVRHQQADVIAAETGILQSIDGLARALRIAKYANRYRTSSGRHDN